MVDPDQTAPEEQFDLGYTVCLFYLPQYLEHSLQLFFISPRTVFSLFFLLIFLQRCGTFWGRLMRF